jgi:hypothetical protein
VSDGPARDEAVATDAAPGGAGPAEAASSSPPADPRRWLPIVGFGVALWATLPQYSGPYLNTEPSKEIADHIIPGILVAVVSLVTLMARKRPGGPGAIPFFSGMAVLLAGFWMVATHVPLISEAFRDLAPWPPTIYHSSAAFAVFGFGLMWTVAHWPDLAAIEAAQAAAKDQGKADQEAGT